VKPLDSIKKTYIFETGKLVNEKKISKIYKRNFSMPGSRHIFWNPTGVFFLKKSKFTGEVNIC